MVQARGLLRDPHPRVLRRQRRRLGRPARADREARVPQVARDRLRLAAADVPLAAQGRRLRHRGLPRHPSRLRRRRRLPPLRRPGAPARHARDRRLRHEPHLERPPVVPGVALEPRLAEARLVRVVGHGRALRGRAHHLHRHRGLQLDVGPGRRRLLLAPLLPSPARPQLRQSRRARRPCWTRCASGSTSASTASGWTPSRTSTSATARTARTCPRRTPSCAACAATSTTRTPTRCCWPRRTSGLPTSSSTSATGDECHMAFHFPVMPRMFMALRREEARPIYEILAQTPGDSRQLPVGPLPAQPRRADARDGGRRGARLHVRRVRQGSAHAHQRRHPPAARAAARQRARRDRARARHPVLAARQPGALLRRRDRHGRQRLPRRSRRRAHAHALDGRPQRRASRAPTSPSSTCRR